MENKITLSGTYVEDYKVVIDEAKKQSAIIVMCVDGYQTELEALYLRDFLWYAKNSGVEVRFVPDEMVLDDDHE